MQAAIHHHFGGNTYAREMHVPAGDVIVKHKHQFDHLSILAAGVVQVEIEGKAFELTGPACINISKDSYHKVTALTNCVWFCIHETDCTDECAIDEVLIAPGSDVGEMQALVT